MRVSTEVYPKSTLPKKCEKRVEYYIDRRITSYKICQTT